MLWPNSMLVVGISYPLINMLPIKHKSQRKSRKRLQSSPIKPLQKITIQIRYIQKDSFMYENTQHLTTQIQATHDRYRNRSSTNHIISHHSTLSTHQHLHLSQHDPTLSPTN